MNCCFVIGKVVSKPEFKFMWKSKNISICIIDAELKNNNIVRVVGYNEIADYLYSNINIGDVLTIDGVLKCNCIEIQEAEKIK